MLVVLLNLAVVFYGTVLYGFAFLSNYLKPRSPVQQLGGVVNLANVKAAFLYVVVLVIALGLMGYELKTINQVWRRKDA
ncbi:hypothetical protein [Larkinella harenae]